METHAYASGGSRPSDKRVGGGGRGGGGGGGGGGGELAAVIQTLR